MKKIILSVIILLTAAFGVVFALQNKQETAQKEGGPTMDKKILVAYFSATGTTKRVAENLARALDCDIYEIKPKDPYTSADLDWTNTSSRSTVEMKDHSSRPEIVQDDFSVEKYDTVFLGFPIWWYIAPTVVNTFLEKHDFSNKKIVLFATSGGSRFGKTKDNLIPSVASSAQIVEGDILNSNPSVDELKKWAEGLK